MQPGPLRTRLDAGDPALGTLVMLEGHASARLVSRCGFDFLIVDVQHAGFDLAQVEAIVTAAQGTSTSVIARVRAGRPDEIEALLDAGAHGVMVPMVNSVADAQQAVDACRYPPRGRRSVGGVRNLLARGDDYADVADDDVVCIIQIEHREGVERIDDILAVPGIDVVSPGHVDLARSMGHRLDYSKSIENVFPEEVAEAITAIRAAGRRHGVPLMPVVGSHDDVSRAFDAGDRVICFSSDFHLLRAAALDATAKARMQMTQASGRGTASAEGRP